MTARTSTSTPAIEEMPNAESTIPELLLPMLGVGVYVPLEGKLPAPPVENPGIVVGTVPRTPLISYRLYVG
jgi:hypothetical protein